MYGSESAVPLAHECCLDTIMHNLVLCMLCQIPKNRRKAAVDCCTLLGQSLHLNANTVKCATYAMCCPTDLRPMHYYDALQFIMKNSMLIHTRACAHTHTHTHTDTQTCEKCAHKYTNTQPTSTLHHSSQEEARQQLDAAPSVRDLEPGLQRRALSVGCSGKE